MLFVKFASLLLSLHAYVCMLFYEEVGVIICIIILKVCMRISSLHDLN